MIEQALKGRAQQISVALGRVDLPAGDLGQAMAYAVRGGKRLRGFLVLEGGALFDVPAQTALNAACAIEALHAYSLVHDDLPCMDDDDLRRGQPTVHRKWDDAMAVLVGDALQTLAFDLLAHAPDLEPQVRVQLIGALARAAGGQGMVLGQAQDIAAETSPAPLDEAAIMVLQRHKTGALIEWSAQAGAWMAGADAQPLLDYARAVGLAFQIADDILDVEGDPDLTGKAVGKDATSGKATFVSLLGLDGARQRASDLVTQAQDALSPYGARADRLHQLARFVITRQA